MYSGVYFIYVCPLIGKKKLWVSLLDAGALIFFQTSGVVFQLNSTGKETMRERCMLTFRVLQSDAGWASIVGVAFRVHIQGSQIGSHEKSRFRRDLEVVVV